MSKTIKLEDNVHRDLEEFRLKKETYSQAVSRAIHQKGGNMFNKGGDMFNRAEWIIQEVCQAYGVSPEILKDARKTRRRSQLRKDISERLRRETALTWQEVGELLGRTKSYRGPTAMCTKRAKL